MRKIAILIIGVISLVLIPLALSALPLPPPIPPTPGASGGDTSFLDSLNQTTQTTNQSDPDPCDDGIKNHDETDIDCGGSCVVCDTDQGCLVNSDCGSLSCIANKCAEATCNDSIRNGGETGIDCGGICTPCVSATDSSEQDTQQSSSGGKRTTEKEGTTSSTGIGTKGDFEGQENVYPEEGYGEQGEITEIYEPKESGLLSNTSILIGSLLLIILLSFIFYNMVQKKKAEGKPKIRSTERDISLDRLRVYVADTLRRGYSPHQIKQTLLRYNHPLENIEEAFRTLRKW